jgi:hypothetical protein
MQKLRDIPEPWRSFLAELDEKATAETRLDCMGGFVVSMEYGFSRETADLDVLVIAPREQVAPHLDLGKQCGPLHKKYTVYPDYVGVAKVPDGYEERLRQMFPGATSICVCAHWTLMTSRFRSSSETSNGIATM